MVLLGDDAQQLLHLNLLIDVLIMDTKGSHKPNEVVCEVIDVLHHIGRGAPTRGFKWSHMVGYLWIRIHITIDVHEA